MKISEQAYGKSNVRLSYINRTDERHDFIELATTVSLSGGFDPAYTEGDNQTVIPTDTMKNSVYAFAQKHGVTTIEKFATGLATYFYEKFPHVERAVVSVVEQLWNRIDADGELHRHAFTGGGKEESTCQAVCTNDGLALHSGLDGLQVLKTTASGFAGFLQDEYTTLPETTDRIFATTITANWPCRDPKDNWQAARQRIRAAILDVFAHRYSPSVQRTLHEMAAAAFEACAGIDAISLQMPNQHHLLADLTPLKLENANQIFVPTAEPFGMIAATIRRETV